MAVTQLIARCFLAALIMACAASLVRADRFALVGGGVVEGTLLNPQQSPRTSYEIETSAGVRIVLPADHVAAAARQKDLELEYAQLAPTYADTVEEQWKLAEWCRARQLKAHRETHLRRIIELSPDHVPARHALGFVQLKGEWTTRSDSLAEQGYVLFRGEWRTPQDIALIQEREKAQQVAKQWLGKLKRWRIELNDPKYAAGAYQRIAEVRAPAAVGPLTEMLRAEPTRDVKTLYIEVLGEIATAEAVEALVYVSLNDGDEEVFHACADLLVRLNPANLADPYVKALKNENNVRINRAAHMLGRLEYAPATAPLIEVLVTTHRVVIAPPKSNGDAISTSFEAGGGNSFRTGDATKVFYQTAQNGEVLTALTRLAGGQTFGYDVAAWRRWHAAQRANLPRAELRP